MGRHPCQKAATLSDLIGFENLEDFRPDGWPLPKYVATPRTPYNICPFCKREHAREVGQVCLKCLSKQKRSFVD